MQQKSKIIELEQPPICERALLATLRLPGQSEEEVDESLDELRQLAWTAGAETVLTVVQAREAPNPGTLFGTGKLSEIKAACEEQEIDVVIVGTDLTGSQGGNLEDLVGCKVVDRTQLILDIFAQRAQTREGKLQVELAQLQYILPRLTGRGTIMRQQGGIGIRGPGEQKLEVDRRRIRNRVNRIRHELERVRGARQMQRKRRSENAVGVTALVGYTNAGKSSLLNALTHAGVLAEDKLFATLDPRVRRCTLPSGREILLADTVGFVRDLPHTLVAAFRATLEQVAEADLLLLVVDAAHPAQEEHIAAVRGVLEEIEASELPTVMVYNKIDQLEPPEIGALAAGRENAVAVSARTGAGLQELLGRVDRELATTRRLCTLRIPQSDGAAVNLAHRHGRILEQEYEGDQVILHAELDRFAQGQLARYLTE